MDAVTHIRFASGDLEKTASIKRLDARLIARAASDTSVILEKGCLKFLYPRLLHDAETPAHCHKGQKKQRSDLCGYVGILELTPVFGMIVETHCLTIRKEVRIIEAVLVEFAAA